MRYEQFSIREALADPFGGTLALNAGLTVYLLDNTPEIDAARRHPMVLICPGGGYTMTSDREAEPVALAFLAKGFHVAVLRYTISPQGYFPTQLFETARAMEWIRTHAEEWHCDTERIVLCGFSAGGHLAASYAALWNRAFIRNTLGLSAEMLRPNGAILCYPVITSGDFAHRYSFDALLGKRRDSAEMLRLVSVEKQVGGDVPPMFIWHTFSDDTVPVENALNMAAALAAYKIPVELHIFPKGGHGLSLCDERTTSCSYGIQSDCAVWMDMASRWLHNL